MASFTLQPGDVVGEHYRLRQMIGAGGMGAVWSARNQATGAFVAIKFLHPALLRNPILVQRFLQESEAGKQAKHPNIIEVYGSGRHAPAGAKESVPYLVMELLEGESLTDLLLREARLGLDTGLVIMRDVARAAHAAHQAGVVHRDLKPANIFLHHDAQGAVIAKMLDFGISKLTDPALDAGLTTTGMLVGSPSTMSPEQAMGKRDIDGRSDVWSIGAMLFRCLTGKPLFSVTSPEAMLLKLLDEEVPLEDTSVLPPSVRAVIARCLRRDRSERYATAAELADALDACITELGLSPDLWGSLPTQARMPAPDDDDSTAALRTSQPRIVPDHDQTATRLAVAVPARKPAGWVVPLTAVLAVGVVLLSLVSAVTRRHRATADDPATATPAPATSDELLVPIAPSGAPSSFALPPTPPPLAPSTVATAPGAPPEAAPEAPSPADSVAAPSAAPVATGAPPASPALSAPIRRPGRWRPPGSRASDVSRHPGF